MRRALGGSYFLGWRLLLKTVKSQVALVNFMKGIVVLELNVNRLLADDTANRYLKMVLLLTNKRIVEI